MDADRPVSHLQGLYTVVVGLAMTVAITNLIDQDGAVPVRLASLPYFIAYLVTLVPFYHGALRHLDVAYIETTTQPKPGALMVDWSFLFIESCGLLALALLIGRPEAFSYGLLGLLAFDAIWAFGAYLAFSGPSTERPAEQKWAIINFAAVILLVLVMVGLDVVDPAKPVTTYRWILVVTVTLARTVWDYSWCWSYYYPRQRRIHAA